MATLLVPRPQGLLDKAADSASEQVEPYRLFPDFGERQIDEDFEKAMPTTRIEATAQG